MSISVVMIDPAHPAGVLADPSKPLISIEDQGLTRGDGVFETMLAVNRRVRKLDSHIARLASSARLLDLPEPDPVALRAALQTLMQAAVPGTVTELGEEHLVKIIISRGTPAQGPHSWVTAAAAPAKGIAQRASGVKAILLPRGHDPAENTAYPWLLAGAKTLSYAMNMAMLRYVASQGADDGIFMTDDRRILEGATSSVIMAKIEGDRKVLYTPEPSRGILPGTTQGAIFNAARADGWELGYGPLYPQDLLESNGLWLVSSVRLLAPVTHVNGTAIATDPELTRVFMGYLAQDS
ncbi:MAG: aminotransferase class IV [Rothia sp. (in: high G+C Gram-positive bacteria)]|uniref:aminotransferase class IV n=1 Tax=Rothia sp. (in: high G+C Gram-positive bacteria) TaxID=1885016 RepID=UPI0026DF410C|nr:aminotransferase class IV [Rothia sp. (in: high G+C Gram-positive bacteria)]MDO5750220.1 aminotransferase class IV [Rothia sp. (in: high G+C Gram-positive bacteria)]